MIAVWMLSAMLFTALLGTAAWCAENALRAAQRQARWPWLVALTASVLWPLAAPSVRRLLAEHDTMRSVTASLPTIRVVPDQLPAAMPWTNQLDIAVIALWLLASAVAFARLTRALIVLARIRRASTLRVVDGIPVLVSPTDGPAVIGFLRASVLLPEVLLDLETDLRRLVLRHEEEHRRARDPWIVLGAAIALVLEPWNVPLWWIVRRTKLALEMDCDARVLESEPDATRYGKLLLLIAQRPSTTAFAPMLVASRSHLERRITAMLPIATKRRGLRIAAALSAAVVVGIAACTQRITDGVAGPKPAIATRASSADSRTPYFEFQVEKQVRQIPGTGNLRYPDKLRSANVQGEVLGQFVVDVEGRYEPGTFKVLKSSHELFTQAVQAALPDMRFQPAEFKGEKVRQLVQQPFTFSLSSSSSERVTSGSSAAERPFKEFTLSKQARMLPTPGVLRYPAELRSANVEGEVLAQFVVDRDGRYLPGSLKVLKSSHPLFTQAVAEALPEMRFEAAEVNGTKVRQMIQYPFTFTLSK